jgi:hypothetical protein
MSHETCPNCGANLPKKAKACPECGSDEMTGWSESAHADNLGLPDEEFDYEKFVQDEFGSGQTRPRGIHWFWWLTALLLIAALIFFFVR